jgi:hypothetical protein
MKNTLQFKVKGINRLLTYEELMSCKQSDAIGRVRVIDLQSQRNWSTSLKNVMVKFK